MFSVCDKSIHGDTHKYVYSIVSDNSKAEKERRKHSARCAPCGEKRQHDSEKKEQLTFALCKQIPVVYFRMAMNVVV